MTMPEGPPGGGPFVLRRRDRAAVAASLLTLIAGVLVAPARAVDDVPRAGQRQVVLHGKDGSRVVVGRLRLDAAGADGRAAFALTMDTAVFTDHFLSMREFKCLPGADEILCHVPYPYPNPGTLTRTDTAWLEHGLLFMFKKPSDYGAKLWNGVVWKLQPRGDGWEGHPQAVDLNLLSAPPTRPGPPLRPALRDDMPEGARWYGRLTIE